MSILGFFLAVSLALIHVLAGQFKWLDRVPHRYWVSLAGGVSIAYIFLDIFPEMSRTQAEFEHAGAPLMGYLEHHVYLLSLLGLALFYGLETLARRSRDENEQTQGEDITSPATFWIHIGAFAIYNALLGYLLQDSTKHGLLSSVLLFIALALHFIVNDRGLREHHKSGYDRVGRWILAASIVTGWVIGQAARLDQAAIATIWSLVAGGIILNVLKEELPAERESHFGAFATGAFIYAVVLLLALNSAHPGN